MRIHLVLTFAGLGLIWSSADFGGPESRSVLKMQAAVASKSKLTFVSDDGYLGRGLPIIEADAASPEATRPAETQVAELDGTDAT
jgi:hypothetical protein